MKFNVWNILIVFIIVYFVFQIHSDIKSYQELQKKTEQIKVNFKKENKRKEELLSLNKKLKDKRFVELVAREKINLVKKGETAYKICQ